MKRLIPFAMAAAIGAIVVLALHSSELPEHWDHPLYWPVAYPSMCLSCAVLGFSFPAHAWAHGFVMIWVQGAYTVATNLHAELIGVTFIILLFISLPVSLCGVVGSSIRRRSSRKQPG